ncbi:hypothetical protein Btru_046574 [Bulinus truncatus]|nr:hypothetical protein Btru_046574 [Bulinus truncatus]
MTFCFSRTTQKSELTRKLNQKLKDDVLKSQHVADLLKKFIDEHNCQCSPHQSTKAAHALTLPPGASSEEEQDGEGGGGSHKRPYPFIQQTTNAELNFPMDQDSVVSYMGDSSGIRHHDSLPVEDTLLQPAEVFQAAYLSGIMNINELGVAAHHEVLPPTRTPDDDGHDNANSIGSHVTPSDDSSSRFEPNFFCPDLPNTSAFDGHVQCIMLTPGHSPGQYVQDYDLTFFQSLQVSGDDNRLSDTASQSSLQDGSENECSEFLTSSLGPDANLELLSGLLSDNVSGNVEYPMDIMCEPGQYIQACPTSPLTPLSPSSPSFPMPTPSPPDGLYLESYPTSGISSSSSKSPLISPGTPSSEKGANPSTTTRHVIRRASSTASVLSPYGGLHLTSSLSPPPSVPSPVSHGLPESPPILYGHAPPEDGRDILWQRTSGSGRGHLQMGVCCSAETRQESLTDQCQGHHSFFIHPEGSFNQSTYNIVYRPPQLNERLAPGEAKPRFWLNPPNFLHGPAVVSIAWCQLGQTQTCSVQPRQGNYKRWKKKKSNRVEAERTNNDCLVVAPGDVDSHPEGREKNMMVKAYPSFLLPYVNQSLRLRLVFTDPKVEQMVGEYGHLKHGRESDSDPMMEMSYLVRNMHSLKLHMKYSCSVQGLPEVQVEENHGGVKRMKRVRYRAMPVSWIDLDHRKPTLHVVGEQFELLLAPPSPTLTPADFPDGNGEIPKILGMYVRSLDTSPDTRLNFSARLFHWFSQSAETGSDVSGPEFNTERYLCP